MKIAVLGLTPAWQKVMLFDEVTLDHVNRARYVTWCVSGKNANVAIGAASLLGEGGTSVLVTPAGGPRFEDFCDELRALGVALCCVKTIATTRTCTTLIANGCASVTELVEEGERLTEAEIAQVVVVTRSAVCDADVVVVTGSLVQGMPPTFYLDLVAGVSETTPIVADIRGEGLLHLLTRPLHLVKPNRHELATTADALRQRGEGDVPPGNAVLRDESALECAMRAIHRCGARHVLVTDGPRGAFAMSDGGPLQRLAPLAVPPSDQRNPIGCGDAVTAGIAWATATRLDPLDAMRVGLACASINLRDILPCRLDAAEATHLARSVR